MVIVPSIDVRSGRVSFRSGVELEVEPRELASAFVADGADELHLVDLDGAERGDYLNLPLLTEIARASGVPCRFAGGLASWPPRSSPTAPTSCTWSTWTERNGAIT